MSRSVRAETRQRAKDEKKHHVSNFTTRKWEKKWVTICDTTMRIYKWVPISGEQQQKKPIIIDNSQNSINSNDKENSKMPRTDLSHEDSSNTCFSFSEMQYQNNNSSDKFLFSEDSNSQSSDILPVKKFKPND